ncbi:MAG: SpoIID/LytB domain-containing protein [Calditrichaeota bacterium]|nr:SpoIID/LytB domain-containing protein [Calditrichota bacterium]
MGLLAAAAVLWLSCAPHVPPAGVPVPPQEPEVTIRVGIVQGRDRVEFATADPYRIVEAGGKVLIDKGQARSLWEVTVEGGRPAPSVFLLVVQTTKDRAAAERLLADLRAKGVEATVDVLGKVVQVGGRELRDYRTYRVRLKRLFPSRQEAQRWQGNVAGIWTTIVEEPGHTPEGTLSLRNVHTGQRIFSSLPVRIEGSRVAIKDVPVAEGYIHERRENRLFRGAMEFMVDRAGKVTVVNVVSLEDYLRGVVPYEMHGDFPLEALKAQAVAARTMVLYTMGSRHPYDPFDVCADVHCQVYGGVVAETEQSNSAVLATAGEVLTYGGQLCEVVFSSCCGGHTEHNENVWQGTAQPYLRGVLDIEEGARFTGRYDLAKEEVLRRWIEGRPAVFCNVGQSSVPAGFGYAAEAFRWELKVSASQIRRTVLAATGQDPGEVTELVPLQRGVSGRIVRLQVKGRNKTVTLSQELNIRKALAEPPLRSSCIVIDREQTASGEVFFHIRGAGSGHGVGMCQTGAAMMALRHGKDYRQILRHYFTGAEITGLY